MKRLLIIMLAALLAACGPTMPSFQGVKGLKPNPYIVDITWNSTNRCIVDSFVEEPGRPCTNPGNGICLDRGDYIMWRSNNPSDAKYEIFFDPILNVPLKTRWWSKGIIRRAIDRRAPEAEYKYSIVRDGCDPNFANTYDPHIRVNN